VPLDPNIITSGLQQQAVPLLTAAQKQAQQTARATALANLQDIQAQIQERQAQAQQRQEAAKDDADTTAALMQTKGDKGAALDLLYQRNARAAQSFEKALDAANKAHADEYHTSLENIESGRKIFSSLANQIADDGSNYATLVPGLRAYAPPGVDKNAFVPDQYNPETVDHFKQLALDANAQFDHQKATAEMVSNGNVRGAVANDLKAALKSDDPDAARQQVLGFWSHQLGVRPSALAPFAAATTADELDQLALTPEQQTTAKQAAATLANTAANQAALQAQAAANAAETHRHNAAEEALAAQREKREAAATIGPSGASDAVLGYVQQLKNDPSFQITAVPAAKGMRDAVIGELKKEGYDLSQPITAQTRAMAEMARSLQPSITKVEQLARQMQQAGLTGSIGGRLRRWASGESAAADLEGLTPAQRTLVGQFTTEAGLLKSGVARAHGGARGGGSVEMLKSLDPLLDPGVKDLDTFLGNLAGAKDFIDIYANQDQRKPQTTTDTSTTTAKEGDRRNIAGGGVAEYRGGKWIRVQ